MRSYLARFAFRGDEVFAGIESLSGGEKGRLTLAVVMRQKHNLLLLDEPTNHLDLDSREALEESLEEFPGSIVSSRTTEPSSTACDPGDRPARGPGPPLPGNYSETADAPSRAAPTAGTGRAKAPPPALPRLRALRPLRSRSGSPRGRRTPPPRRRRPPAAADPDCSEEKRRACEAQIEEPRDAALGGG
jgi:hypothetical protein